MLLLQLTVTAPIDEAMVTGFVGSPLFYAVIVGLVIIVGLVVGISIFRARLKQGYQTGASMKKVLLLVTVPKESAEKGDSGQREKTLQEIQEDIAVMTNIFSAVGGLHAQRGAKAAVVGREDSVSFEIVAKDGLISFYVAVNPEHQEFIEQQIQAQYNHADIDVVEDYNIFSPQGQVAATSFKFKRQNFLPIKTFRHMDADPLNALTNSLSTIEKGDGAVVQVICRSSKKGWRDMGLKVAREMHQGKKMHEAMKGGSMLKFVGEYMKPKKDDGKPDKEYKMSDREQEMVKSIEEKAGQMGLDVNIRIVTSAQSLLKAKQYLSNIVGSFSQYGVPQYGNELHTTGKKQSQILESFIFRHFDEKLRFVMAGDELASLYHMPLPSTETPNIRWLMARKAAPPSNIPKEGFFLGTADYRGVTTNIYQKHDDRFRHMYLIGGSGAGKSEYLANLISQDIQAGLGVGVIDPHGDLVETVLSTIPKERAEDVVLFDPSDHERPMGLNMLESPSPEMDDFVVGEMIAIFYKLFPPEMIGPMFEHTMRNMMLTLMSDRKVPGTIAEVPRLVTDEEFQKKWIAKVTDPVVRSYWENEVAKTSDFHKSEMFGYITSKVGRFVENAMMRNIIGQQKSAFDFRDVMDNKKILLVNLSKGKIGDVNADLLGLIIVTKLQMAAMARADMPKEDRKDFMLYIDEFQNFVTPSIATILSEARKYRLSLIVAHQYIAQLAPKGDTEVRDAIIGNVGTKLVGRIGIDDAEFLEKEFAPVFTSFDLMNVPMFQWNTKLLIDNTVARPFVTKSPMPVTGNAKLAAAIKQLARLKYGRDRAIVEQEILERTKVTAAAAPDRSGQGSSA